VALLTLNRPEKLNAVNVPMIEALHAALDAAEADDGVRAVVARGRGRAFSAGFDLDMGSATPSRTPRRAARARGRFPHHRALLGFAEATVAAVHGYCLGSGMELALACDITSPRRLPLRRARGEFGSGIVALLLPWLAGPKAANSCCSRRRTA
jgi:enoyl-CoA hydratase